MRRFAMLLLTTSSVWGCECSGWMTPKAAWQEAAAVFYGTVLSVEPPARDFSFTTHVTVDRPLKGSSPGQMLDIASGGSLCEAKFAKDYRGLFFLFRDSRNGGWRIPACFHSGASLEAFLHKLPQSGQGSRLAGIVAKSDAGYRDLGPVRGLTVKLLSASGARFQTQTDASGLYEMYGLPAGNYQIMVNPPIGWRVNRVQQSSHSSLHPNLRSPGDTNVVGMVNLMANGEAEVNFDLRADTRITGRLLNWERDPVPNVCFELVPFDEPAHGVVDRSCSRDNGRFSFAMIPPGKYLIMAHDFIWTKDLTSQSTLYFPGVRTRTQAMAISASPSKYGPELEIVIPDHEQRHEVAGVVENGGGVFHSGKVVFAADQLGYVESSDIRADGTFRFTVLDGVDGWLYAAAHLFPDPSRPCPEGEKAAHGVEAVESVKLALMMDGDHRGLTLLLPWKPCEAGHRK